MTALQTIREWITKFPQYSELREFSVDYTEAAPGNGGIMPGGLTEIARTKDICGNVTVTNQYSFTLYFVFEKAQDDDEGAEKNAQFLMDFQNWVQAQSATGAAPQFGDDPRRETMKAQNGALYGTDAEGTALYTVQLTVDFKKYYGGKYG